MKLLGWMPKKLKQQGRDTLKNFALGNSCTCLSAQALLEEQRCYNQPIMCQKSPIRGKDNGEQEAPEEESSITISNLFHGFLAIGTLGSEPITTEPTTPKFAVSFANVIEKETEVTDNELKLINYELDKFLEAEAEEEGNESSERSSYASIITLSGTKTEAVDAEEYENMVVCPLQGYLFGSSIELPETGVEVKKEKTSLGELFKNNNNLGNQQNKGDGKGEEKRSKGTYGTHFMNKILKKLRSSSKRSTIPVTADDPDSVSNKRKLPKVLRMFHKKIHPEKSPAEKWFTKSQKYETNPTAKGEHWIKTDADYLVLEL